MTPDPERPTLSSVMLGLGIALCAVLLLRWLALVALAVLVVVGAVRWARGLPVLPAGVRRRFRQGIASSPPSGGLAGPSLVTRLVRPTGPTAPVGHDEDLCSWCGRPGGHLGRDGERIRPRHAHVFR